MTSLDAALARWANTPASDLAWGPLRAKAVADQTAQAGGLNVLWEVVEITDFLDENLSADPDLLRATALPSGWDDDFNTEAFCANDLFVESV